MPPGQLPELLRIFSASATLHPSQAYALERLSAAVLSARRSSDIIGLQSLNPSNPSLSPAYWDQAASPQSRLWRDHADSLNRDWLERSLTGVKGLRVLKTDAFDEVVGPGIGGDLLDRFDQVVIMDLGGEMIRAAARRLPVHASQADARTLPFSEASFDAVVSLSTFDHFREHSDIAAAISECARVLKTGGSLLITMDNLANPIVWLRNEVATSLLMRLRIVPYFVGKTYTLSGLERAVEEAGLEIVNGDCLMHCPRILGVMACRLTDRLRSDPLGRAVRGVLRCFEWLRRGPFPGLTGYYVAVCAVKNK